MNDLNNTPNTQPDARDFSARTVIFAASDRKCIDAEVAHVNHRHYHRTPDAAFEFIGAEMVGPRHDCRLNAGTAYHIFVKHGRKRDFTMGTGIGWTGGQGCYNFVWEKTRLDGRIVHECMRYIGRDGRSTRLRFQPPSEELIADLIDAARASGAHSITIEHDTEPNVYKVSARWLYREDAKLDYIF